MDTLEESVGRMLEGIGRVGRRNGAGGQFLAGRVLSASPLRVACPDGELGREDLWVNPALLAREGPALARGDRVALLTVDRQDYYLVCKAVRP